MARHVYPSLAAPQDTFSEEMSLFSGFVTLMTPIMNEAQQALQDTLNTAEEDALHRLRVAVRKLRALWWAFSPSPQPPDVRKSLAHLKAISHAAGNARDWDIVSAVLAQDKSQRGHRFALTRKINLQRRRAQRKAQAKIRILIKETDLASMLTAMLACLAEDNVAHESRREHLTLGRLARDRLKRAKKQFLMHVHKARKRKHPDYESLHEIRKTGKKLRYLLEFFAPLLKRAKKKPAINAAKQLTKVQTQLGSLNDVVASEILLEQLVPLKLGDEERTMALQWIAQRKRKRYKRSVEILCKGAPRKLSSN